MECEVVSIPAATFVMGSNDEEIARSIAEWSDRLIRSDYASSFETWLRKESPEHKVSVDAFEMMCFPVTNGAYRRYLADCGAPPPMSTALGLPDNHAVWGVTRQEAREYAAWFGTLNGGLWRLPSEAEWEWSAGGPMGLRYPYGNVFRVDACNTIESGIGSTEPVGARPGGVSPFGVFDMAGNVEEWTEGGYAPYPGGNVVEDDLYHLRGLGYGVLRGGSFALGGDLARTRRRHGCYTGPGFEVTGFRLVRTTI